MGSRSKSRLLVAAGSLAVALSLGSTVRAQTWHAVPDGFGPLPGNAAVSLPARWTFGTMQVILDEPIVAHLVGETIDRIRMRRPTAFADPDYPARTITLAVAIGPSHRTADNMSGRKSDQYDAQNPLQVVYPEAATPVAMAPAPGQADAVGAPMIDLALAVPYVVPPATGLLIEWRVVDSDFAIRDDGWVDAVWLQGGQDLGLALPVGQHGCGSDGEMRLSIAAGSEHPAFDAGVSWRLEGAQPGRACQFGLGVDPLADTIGGFGSDISIFPFLPGCQLWSPLKFFLVAPDTGPLGAVDFSFGFPPSPTLQGIQIGAQAFVVEADDQGVPTGIAASNGTVLWMDTVGVGDQVATAFFLEDQDDAVWPPYTGLCPVVEFRH